MNPKYSLVIGGVLVSVLGAIFINVFGFSDVCSNEIVAKIIPLLPVVVGGTMSYVGRVRQGDVKLSGFKK